ncbi:MAG: hypothetical protein ABFS56_19305 [Pseudomonadota bacterium]
MINRDKSHRCVVFPVYHTGIEPSTGIDEIKGLKQKFNWSTLPHKTAMPVLSTDN